MAQRLARFHQQLAATRSFLEWLAVAAASVLLAAFTIKCSAQPDDAHRGQLLRPGIELVDIACLPADGWYRVTVMDGMLRVRAVAAPVSAPGEEEAEAIDTRYIRVPGARIAEGLLPTVADEGGVPALIPGRAHHFELAGKPFSLTLHNGLVYSVATDDDVYSFHIPGGLSPDRQLLAIADLDSDGKPDILLRVGDQEMLLLSSLTSPGLNPPAALQVLHTAGR